MILLTGATGFVGQAVLYDLQSKKLDIAVVKRNQSSLGLSESIKCISEEINADTDWKEALEEVNVVIHTAARVHVMRETAANPLNAFLEVNTQGTINLAEQAAAAGVRRFIFISSIKVNGESTQDGCLFTPDDEFIPSDPYAVSKYRAEQALLDLAHKTDMEVVIIRPPLIYGPGVKANFAEMIRWIHKGVPLPFGRIQNKRSFIAIDNLVNFITLCIEHPKAANEIFTISDTEDVSTTELLRKVAKALDRKLILLPVPVVLMEFAAFMLRKRGIAQRLFGSLQVDSSKAYDLLGWKPITTMDQQLLKTVNVYLDEETF